MELWLISGLLLLMLIWGCKSENSTKSNQPAFNQNTSVQIDIPSFNRDSAYAFVEKQVLFGPRVPGTEAHKECKEWIVSKFNTYNLEVSVQNFTEKIGDHNYPGSNIIAVYNPQQSKRILLAAHWDSRNEAEKDKDPEKRDDAILGADDGASGVAILVEIARVIHMHPIDMGIDFVLFDVEDQGINGGSTNTWCVGSQYWSKNPHFSSKPEYGILLDMVGAKSARFPKEGASMNYAREVVNKVWGLAGRMGYGGYFVNELQSAITDDHIFINRVAKIPTIDIVNMRSNGTFDSYHHTHSDDMNIIDKSTLRVVGQVVLATLFRESEQNLPL